jgi:PPK2 family polyphosphate:nucleotide phosphotransferase
MGKKHKKEQAVQTAWSPTPVPLGAQVDMSDYDPDDTGPFQRKSEVSEQIQANLKRMATLQELMFAEGKHGLLIVLQAMDGGGKDSTIRHVMAGFNPQGCHVASFVVPTKLELAHDFLWRVHPHAPQRGFASIFNRSHYEDVLVARVNELVPTAVWQARYEHINAFERLLADSEVTIRKFLLHISKDEQKRRLEERLERREKNWKFNPEDLKTRAKWDDYMRAFEDAITRCNQPWAPWYIVPANCKWYRNLFVSTVLVEAMQQMDMHYPPAPEGIEDIQIE